MIKLKRYPQEPCTLQTSDELIFLTNAHHLRGLILQSLSLFSTKKRARLEGSSHCVHSSDPFYWIGQAGMYRLIF